MLNAPIFALKKGKLAMSEQKITYTTLGSSPEFHQRYEEAIVSIKKSFGKDYPAIIGGAPVPSKEKTEIRSPIDRRIVLGTVAKTSRGETARAVELAHSAFRSWQGLDWKERVAILRRGADELTKRKYEFTALMCYEAGKNRLESMGETEESIDLVRYYCGLMEEHKGYEMAMQQATPEEKTQSRMRAYGVWGVIAPFNFPLALSIGMVTGALVCGNCVVFKPAHDTPIIGALMCEILHAGGVPKDVLHYVPGSGSEVGATLVEHPLSEGLAFTGSYDVGMKILKSFSSRYPKPIILEMGGKNPAIVTNKANLEDAIEGVARSAFGFGGQKCSACSRVYLFEGIRDKFIEGFVKRTEKVTLGNPLQKEVFLGPVINESAVKNFETYVRRIEKNGGKILFGGKVRKDGDFGYGYYVEPTVAFMKNSADELFQEEMFLPIVLLTEVKDLDEALTLSNNTVFGLTAGIFSTDQAEVDKFLNGINAGVTYANRKGGATTGAWPGINPFGGWKGSGSCGPSALGPYYLMKFMREQSRTVIM